MSARHLGLVALFGAASLAACSPAPSPPVIPATSPTPSATVSASPVPSVVLPTSTPAETVSCLREPGPLPSALAGDPCPSAIAAVRTVVAPLGQSIARISIQPRPFSCGVIWPGVGSPVLCFEPLILPGRSMHGWVSFRGTPKVAAVALDRAVPVSGTIPSPLPPWKATLVVFEVPPAGWVMP